MNCERRDFRRAIDWSAARNGKVNLKGAITRRIQQREVQTLKQVQKWFSATPDAFVTECLNELVDEGAVVIRANGPHSGHSHRQGFCYEAVQVVEA